MPELDIKKLRKERRRVYMREYMRKVREAQSGVPVVPRGPYKSKPSAVAV